MTMDESAFSQLTKTCCICGYVLCTWYETTGIEGKYCLHFHKLRDCPDCLFKNNAIETSHQRGIIIHSTHSSTTEGNVLYNVRGAGVYIEDGNEMYNSINYNSIICPFPFKDDTLHGCTIPGTSNRIADTSDNQSGIFR